jgi:hypothetical protein
MLFPQILKRVFYPRRLAAGRASPEKHHPGADRTPARSGKDVLEETVATEEAADALDGAKEMRHGKR